VLRKLWRLAADRPYRNMMWLRWRQPANAFQPYNDTQPDRYPRIFEFVQHQLGAQSELRILSFGCSTGEEVFSLRRYFSQAAIKGIDVNTGNIEVARARLARDPDAMLSFENADSTTAEAAAAYDAIFCMAVLRHGDLGLPGVTRCDHLVRFADFATMVADFSRCLKPGGLLVIRHSNFRLCDTPTSAAFATVLSVPTKAIKGKTPLFGPDNKLLAGIDYPDTVFRKTAPAERRS
jgi:2-polyprenyl-3-methyl-5-hydroxy-6-metoxy-1,4-benzoquinol methylase